MLRQVVKSDSLCLKNEVVDRVAINVDRHRATRSKTAPAPEKLGGQTSVIPPIPSVVFSVEKEVGGNDGHASGHDDENDGDQKHEAVDVVDLVCPEGGEDEVSKHVT